MISNLICLLFLKLRFLQGKVTITIPRFAYTYLLQPIYAEFCQRYPNVNLEISISDKTENIISEGFDLGIRFGDRIEEGMVARQLTPPMREALFVSQQYKELNGVPKVLSDLNKHKLIQYRFIASNQLAPLKLNNKGQTVTVDMPLALICNDTELMVDAAIKGLGIGRVIDLVIKEELDSKQLIPVLEEYWQPYPGLYLFFNQNSQRAKRVRVLIDFLLEKNPL